MEFTFNFAVIAVVAVIVLLFIILFIAGVVISKKNGKDVSIGLKLDKNELTFKTSGGDKKPTTSNTVSDKSDKLETADTVDTVSTSRNKSPYDFSKLKNHDFFTSVRYKYTNETCPFSLYDTMCDRSIKHEDPDLKEFKKVIASKYLHKCLFTYLCESLKAWISSVIEEYNCMEDKNVVPTSYYSCIELIMRYQEETKKIARTLDFQFKNKVINGIPLEFIDTFNRQSIKKITVIQTLVQNIVTKCHEDTWFNRMLEVLDVFEMALEFVQHDVDATLIILNGEMEKYVDQIK